MNWTPRRAIALALGLWIIIAPAVAAASVVAMTNGMTMSAHGGDTGCDDCPATAVPGSDCAQSCLSGLFFGIVPDVIAPTVIATHQSLPPQSRQVLSGRSPVPEPRPPDPIQSR